MPGLNFRLSGGAGTGGFMGGSGVAAALPPSYAGSSAGATISARAYGVGSDTGTGGPATPALGATIAGLTGIALMLYLWYSLPH